MPIIILNSRLKLNGLKERPQTALIVAVNLNHDENFAEDLSEAIALAESAGYVIEQVITCNRPKPDPTYFVGKGKLDEIKTICETIEPQVLIINHNILATQERNLDIALTDVRIIDRTQLILEIFAQRVTSMEGILQVEVAQQSFLATRLVGRWADLDRQRGGIGMRGGIGEKQLELDKRAIRDKVLILRKRLDEIVRQREVQRKSRLNSNISSVSIVGYTNAGKSTLFNMLTKANVYAENRLFATLQTTSRKLFINEDVEIILSDTVGFIRELPTKLIAAFRATLEEAVFANLLLHVIDLSSSDYQRQIENVNLVLDDIDVEHTPQLMVYNKIDLVDDTEPHIEYDENMQPLAVYISAMNNQGLDLLRLAICEKLTYLKNKPSAPQDLVYEPWKFK